MGNKIKVPKLLGRIVKSMVKRSDIGKIMKDTEKREQQEIKDLESRSKQLYELVATENFTVNEVIAESYATSFTPRSEMIIGGISPVYRGGFTSRLVLKVSPDNQDVRVRTINFEGISIVRAGDYISAQIPRYKEKRIKDEFNIDP